MAQQSTGNGPSKEDRFVQYNPYAQRTVDAPAEPGALALATLAVAFELANVAAAIRFGGKGGQQS